MIGRMCKVGDGLSRPVLIARKTFVMKEAYAELRFPIEVGNDEVFCWTRSLFSQVIYAVAIAVRNHLFPFRTEKLSSPALMVLTYQLGE